LRTATAKFIASNHTRDDSGHESVGVDSLIGPVHYRVLVTGQPVTRSFTDTLVEHVLTQNRDQTEVK